MLESVDRRVVSYGDTVLYQSDVETLREGHWLSDRILSFAIEYCYNSLLNEEEKEKICVIQPAVCQMLKFMDFSGALALCESLAISEKEHVIVVMNDHSDPFSVGGSHWSLLIYRPGESYFTLVDSLAQPLLTAAKQILKVLAKCLGLNAAELRIADVTVQHNGSDCGLYAIEYVRLYFENISKCPSAVNFCSISRDEIIGKRHYWYTLINSLCDERRTVADICPD